ncbi:hypothetical protein [Derxia gummosa]|uniref:Uncharacterized protein n=1 Tax=Derxia gummosa DSM 723 TaxID=1121388 RepID=A0A8B6XBY8_9BURK|nr:hypothetical protein [Derxia gummosa]
MDRSLYVFGNKSGSPYTKSGAGTIWGRLMDKYMEKHADTGARRFALNHIRPAAITEKFERRDADRYDFAAHTQTATTDSVYDRRAIRRSKPLS